MAICNQRDKAGSRGWGRGAIVHCGGDQRGRDQHRARRVQGVDGKGSSGGAWDGVAVSGARPVTDLAFRVLGGTRGKGTRYWAGKDSKVGRACKSTGAVGDSDEGRLGSLSRWRVGCGECRRRVEQGIDEMVSTKTVVDNEHHRVHTGSIGFTAWYRFSSLVAGRRGLLIFAPFFSNRPGLLKLGRPELCRTRLPSKPEFESSTLSLAASVKASALQFLGCALWAAPGPGKQPDITSGK